MPLLLILALFLTGSTLALAEGSKPPSGCTTYFALQQADSRLTDIVGNRGAGLKANVMSRWPDNGDPLAPQRKTVIVYDDKRAAPNAVGLAVHPRTFETHSSPLPKEELVALEDWFVRKGMKEFPGLCLDPDKATYLLAIGMAANAAPGECPTKIYGPDRNGKEGWNTQVCSLQVTSAFLSQKNAEGRMSVADGVKPKFFYFVLSEWSNQSSDVVQSPGKLNFYTLRPAFTAMLKQLSSVQNTPLGNP
ncbi:MAG: hypothetical protein WCC22_12015 [Terriglobales bacterium]